MNLISWNWTKEEKEDSVFGLKLFGLTMDTGSYIMVNLTDKVTDGHPDWYRWYVKEDVLKTLPLYCAAVDKFTMSGKMLSTKETDYRCVSTICKTADGGIKYQEDDKFLQDCLLWSLCTAQHKCSSESKFYKVCEELLDEEHKETEIYKLYKSLVEKTGKNGFYNIKKFKSTDRDYGKMWVYLNFNDLIDKLENILDIYFYEVLRPKFFEYELLK